MGGSGEVGKVRFAYADPPYIGMAKKYYSHDPLCAEVDHAELIARLCRDFPDGWALSASSPSLGQIIPLLPDGSCATLFEVKKFEYPNPEPKPKGPMFDRRPPWGMRSRQA